MRSLRRNKYNKHNQCYPNGRCSVDVGHIPKDQKVVGLNPAVYRVSLSFGQVRVPELAGSATRQICLEKD